MQDMLMQAIITLSLKTKTNGMSSMMNSSDKSNTQKSNKKALEERIKILPMKSRYKIIKMHTFCFMKESRHKTYPKCKWKKLWIPQ